MCDSKFDKICSDRLQRIHDIQYFKYVAFPCGDRLNKMYDIQPFKIEECLCLDEADSDHFCDNYAYYNPYMRCGMFECKRKFSGLDHDHVLITENMVTYLRACRSCVSPSNLMKTELMRFVEWLRTHAYEYDNLTPKDVEEIIMKAISHAQIPSDKAHAFYEKHFLDWFS